MLFTANITFYNSWTTIRVKGKTYLSAYNNAIKKVKKMGLYDLLKSINVE